MSDYKIKSHGDQKKEMLAVARGEIPVPEDAASIRSRRMTASSWRKRERSRIEAPVLPLKH